MLTIVPKYYRVVVNATTIMMKRYEIYFFFGSCPIFLRDTVRRRHATISSLTYIYIYKCTQAL